MKNGLKQKLIKDILKVLKLKNKNQLLKLERKKSEDWDSLVHLEILFIIEKSMKKKISIKKLNKISKGKEILKYLNENKR
tara:strand:- start:67 stop:306 length:240 start_codon:yes stop_codon:yes gene_type:complete